MTIDSYSESNYSGNFEIWSSSARYQVSQSFTGDGNVLGSIQMYLSKLGSPSGNITVYVYAHTGTFGTSSLPTGAILATSSTVNANTLSSASYALTSFTFSGGNQITLANGTKYVLVVDFQSGDGSNTVKVGMDISSPSHGGNSGENDARYGGWSARNSYDLCFYVFSTGVSPSLSPSVSASITPSVSPSITPSFSPSVSMSLSLSLSPSPSPAPPPFFGIKISKPGVNVLTNSDIDKLIFSSDYGTLKYFHKGQIDLTVLSNATDQETTASGYYEHNLGYFPFVEVYFKTPTGFYVPCPTILAGASTSYGGSYNITTSRINFIAENSGYPGFSSNQSYSFIFFIFKNNLNL